MNLVDVVGTAAIICTSIACTPQIYKVWTSRSAKDISYLWIAIYSTGCCFWLWYGTLTNNHIILISDSVVLSVQAILLVSKLYTDGKFEKVKTWLRLYFL